MKHLLVRQFTNLTAGGKNKNLNFISMKDKEHRPFAEGVGPHVPKASESAWDGGKMGGEGFPMKPRFKNLFSDSDILLG
jgi:hypothetical protein